MSITTLNKYKKILKDHLKRDKAMIKRYQGAIADTASDILDYENQIEDVDTAILILKKHMPMKGKK